MHRENRSGVSLLAIRSSSSARDSTPHPHGLGELLDRGGEHVDVAGRDQPVAQRGGELGELGQQRSATNTPFALRAATPVPPVPTRATAAAARPPPRPDRGRRRSRIRQTGGSSPDGAPSAGTSGRGGSGRGNIISVCTAACQASIQRRSRSAARSAQTSDPSDADGRSSATARAITATRSTSVAELIRTTVRRGSHTVLRPPSIRGGTPGRPGEAATRGVGNGRRPARDRGDR